MLQLLSKRDQLKSQMGSASGAVASDGRVLSTQEQFDELERQLNALMVKYESEKEKLTQEQKLKIEVNNGLFMLSDKLAHI